MKLKDENRRQRILTAAITVLAAGGLANFSTTKVAKQAEVPQSNLYIYFANKQELLIAVYQTTVHQQSLAVAAALETTTPVTTQLAASVRALYAFTREHPATTTAIQTLVAAPAFKTTATTKLNDVANQQIQTLLRDGVAQGILRPANLNILRYFLTDPVYRVATLATPTEPADLEQLTAMVLGAVLTPAAYQVWLTEK